MKTLRELGFEPRTVANKLRTYERTRNLFFLNGNSFEDKEVITLTRGWDSSEWGLSVQSCQNLQLKADLLEAIAEEVKSLNNQEEKKCVFKSYAEWWKMFCNENGRDLESDFKLEEVFDWMIGHLEDISDELEEAKFENGRLEDYIARKEREEKM